MLIKDNIPLKVQSRAACNERYKVQIAGEYRLKFNNHESYTIQLTTHTNSMQFTL